jgi:hypothetical protein
MRLLSDPGEYFLPDRSQKPCATLTDKLGQFLLG